MRKVLLFPVAAILALVFFGDVAKAYEINGYVYNSAGKGIPDVWVELLDDVYTVIKRVRTSASGHYSFPQLPGENDYIIRVLTDGVHISQERRVETGRDSATQHESTDFYLRAHPEFEEQAKAPTASKKAAASKPDPSGKARAVPPIPPAAANEFFVQEVPPAARSAYEEGVRLLETNPEGGRLKLKEAIDLFPDYFAALERYGVECVKAGQWETGTVAVNRAITVNPRSHVSFFALGVAQFQLKQFPKAIETLTKMFLMAPDTPNGPFAHYCLGMSLLKTGKPADAEPELRLAKPGMNIPSDVHLALAQIYSSTNRYAEAADEIEQLLEKEPVRSDATSLRQLITHLRAKAR